MDCWETIDHLLPYAADSTDAAVVIEEMQMHHKNYVFPAFIQKMAILEKRQIEKTIIHQT
jgi:hypothetical protein